MHAQVPVTGAMEFVTHTFVGLVGGQRGGTYGGWGVSLGGQGLPPVYLVALTHHYR